MLPGLVVLGFPGGFVPAGVLPLWSVSVGAGGCPEVGGLAGVVLLGVVLAGVLVLLQREFSGNSLHNSVFAGGESLTSVLLLLD